MNEDVARAGSGKKVALGVSGGIAAYKAVEVLRGLQRMGCEVRVAMTKRACEFVQPLTFRALSGAHVVVDDYAADNPDPIAHITFSQKVDLLLIAPATANLIAKFASGIADDFLSATYLASTAPVLIAPAMNTRMWEHPATQRNLRQLIEDGVRVIQPDAGEMACKTIGPGRLSEPEHIVQTAIELIDSAQGNSDLRGEKFLITAGATREAIDPVRFISNRSSGRMGFAIAEAARQRGAEVTVVSGITSVSAPPQIKVIETTSAEEMYQAVLKELDWSSVFIGAAAVSDYRPIQTAKEKIKKHQASMSLTLEKTPDIVAKVGAAKREGRIVIGFAAETENVLSNALEKLNSKRLDLVIANDVSRTDSGFDSENNAITIIRGGSDDLTKLPLTSKLEAAHRILDEVVKLRRDSARFSAAQKS